MTTSLRCRRRFPVESCLYRDEIDLLTSNTTYPQSLVAVMQTGRRYQIDAFPDFLGQPNNLHNRVRTQLTEVYTFLHTDSAALKFLTDTASQRIRYATSASMDGIYRHLRTGEEKSNVRNLPIKQPDDTREAKT